MVDQPVVDAGEDRGGAILPDGQAGGRVAAADPGFDGVEIADEGHAFLGNRRESGAGDLDQLAARVSPAICELDGWTYPARCDQAVVSGVAVDLQDAAKTLQDPFGMLPAPTGGIGEDHTRWRRPAPRSVIAGQRPEVSRLGLSRPWVEDWGARLVHEELGGPLQVRHQRVMDREEFIGGTPNPIRKGGAVKFDTLTAVDLGLPVERQVIRVFADQHMRYPTFEGDNEIPRTPVCVESRRPATTRLLAPCECLSCV